MPPNSPQTLLPLETFRQILSWQPFHFYQLANATVPITDSCSPLVREYQWQKSKNAGRYDIREALATAEQRLAEMLNYEVGIRYRSEVLDPGYLKRVSGPPQTYGGGGWYGGYASSYAGWWRYGPALLQLSVGKLQRVATVSYTQLVSSTALNHADTDNDGLNDTFTATFADMTSDPAQVIIAFSAADQVAGSATTALSQQPLDWQIRPVKVTRLNATTLQAVGPSWLLVKPAKYEGYYVGGANQPNLAGVDTSGALNPATATNFVTELTAWLKTYSSPDVAQYVQRYGSEAYSIDVPVTWVDGDLGQLQIDLSGVCRAPSCWPNGFTEEIRINYEAGVPPQYLRGLGFTGDWNQVVTRYAIAELQRPICSCADMNQQLSYWQQDLAMTGMGESNNQSLFRVANDILDCPLGTRRGAVDAWRAVGRLAQHRAVNC
jgi:hypothetical protein